MGCSSCNNRQKLFARTVQNIVRTIKGNTVSTVVGNLPNSDCNIVVKLTFEGYVAECKTHKTRGKPTPVPEQAKVECNGK